MVYPLKNKKTEAHTRIHMQGGKGREETWKVLFKLVIVVTFGDESIWGLRPFQ